MKILTSSRKTFLWLIVFLLLFVGISYLVLSKQPKQYPDFLSTSPSPTGVKALYTYLEGVKDAERWEYEPNKLEQEDRNQLLFMVEPFFTPEQEEMEAYERYMESGNKILLLQQNPTGMFETETTFLEGESMSTVVENVQGNTYEAKVHPTVRLQPSNNDEVLLYDQDGPIAIKKSYGKGQLIVALAPEWATNEEILQSDHLELLFELINEANPETILFDEYVHGLNNQSNVTTLYPKWFLVLMVQSIIFTLLWLVLKGKRFGPIFIPREETVRFSDEKIKALAAWYLRSRNYKDALGLQTEYLKYMLQEKWGIPYRAEWKDLNDALQRKWLTVNPKEIREFLEGLTEVLNKETISKQEFLLWSKKLEQLRKEVDEA